MGASRSPARQTDCRPGRPTALLSLCSLPLFLWAIARSLAPSPSRQNLTLNISVRVRLHSAAADATDASSFLAPSSTRLRPPPRRKEKEEKRVRSGQELAERSRVKRSPSSSSSPRPPSLRRLGQERRKTLDSGQCGASSAHASAPFAPSRARSISRALVVGADGRATSQESESTLYLLLLPLLFLPLFVPSLQSALNVVSSTEWTDVDGLPGRTGTPTGTGADRREVGRREGREAMDGGNDHAGVPRRQRKHQRSRDGVEGRWTGQSE